MVLDEDVLDELHEDLGAEFAAFVEGFLDGARRAMRAMEVAAADGDTAAVGAEAHKLKGTAGYLGAQELGQALGALQDAAENEEPGDLGVGLAGVAAALSRTEPALRAFLAR
jgi:HPt (histidine-containing phosphotransfer) domain-containing protein